jgi:ubiquinol-cytochrome c reductase cytochrome c subunit
VERIGRAAFRDGDRDPRQAAGSDDGKRDQDRPVEDEHAVSAEPPLGDGEDGHRSRPDRRQDREDEMDARHAGQRNPPDGRRAIGGWLALAAIVAALVASGNAVRVAAAPVPGGAVAQVDAAALYQATCASCHGPAGEGTAAGPSLIGVGAASADFYLRTGRMPMGAPGQQAIPQQPAFDEEEIRALVAYVAGFGGGPEIPQVAAGGDLRDGQRLYTANCAACHAATGSGNAVGGGFAAVGIRDADPTTIAEAMLVGPGAMPRFEFEPADRDAIVAYVRYLRESPSPGGLPIGGLGPVAEGFVAVAVGLVILVLITMFVGRRTHRGEPADEIPSGPRSG